MRGQAAASSHHPPAFVMADDGSISIDLAKLSSPERVYDADVAWVVRGNGFVSVLFGKQSIDDPSTLESRIELKYAPEAFVAHFWTNSREFQQGLKEHLKSWPEDPLLVAVDGRTLKFTQGKTHSEWVNFDLIARSGSHGTIDFFYVPPFGVSQAKRRNDYSQLTVVPVVRVMLTIHEIGRLLDAAEAVVADVKKYLPAGVLDGK
jgi:hypothetical protein